jgi:hypothetical protein
MNLKRITALFLLLFAFTFVGMAQQEEEDSQMFGSKRSLDMKARSWDFQNIAVDAKVEHSFKIKNPFKTDLTIGEMCIPEGMGVTVLNKTIAPGQEGVFMVTVNGKDQKKPGAFKKEIYVKLSHSEGEGDDKATITKEVMYSILGTVK